MAETSPSVTESRGGATEPFSTKVVRAVANETNTDPVELPPLYYEIDPDALDRLFDPSTAAASVERLTFTMAGCDVAIDDAGQVTVTETESTVESGFDE